MQHILEKIVQGCVNLNRFLHFKLSQKAKLRSQSKIKGCHMTGLSPVRALIALTVLLSATISLSPIAVADTSNSSDSVESKYFRHIMFRESPWANYRGIHPIDTDAPPAVAHYQFDYDSEQRVVAIRYQINNDLIDDNQVWDSFIWFAPGVKIEYGESTELHTYYNVNGEQVAVHGDVYSARYSLDEDGNRTSLHFYNEENQPSQNAWNIHHYEWRYNNGIVNEKRFDLSDIQQPMRPVLQFYEVNLEYDDKGQLAFIRNLGTTGEPTNNDSGAGIDRIVYDQYGNFVRWQVYDKDGNPVEGNRPMVHVGEHLYDQFGNKVGMRGFDRYGNQVPFSWSAYEHVYTFDDYGNQRASDSFSKSGELEVSIIRTYTNDNSRLKSISTVSETGERIPSPVLSGAAYVEFNYDENGNRTHQFFNADGSPLRTSETSSTN